MTRSRAADAIGAFAWILAAQFFVAQAVVATAWTTPFSLITRFISDLGNTACGTYPAGSTIMVCSPWHLGMNVSFIALGVTMVFGAIFARDAFASGWRRTLAIALFALAALGVILVGVYPENENNARHVLGAGLNFTAGNVALILFGLSLHTPPGRPTLARFSVAAGVVGVLATVFVAREQDLGLGAGGMERLAAYPITIWQIVMGLALWRANAGRTQRGANALATASVAVLALASCGRPLVEGAPRARALPPGVEALSLLGDTLRAFPLAPAVRQRYEQQLADAKRAYDRTPTNADSIIWYARRLGYLGRVRESITVYTRGIGLYPDDPWMYRHRGHRYITVREFDNAVRDLERAWTLSAGKPDVVEPDGQPNPANQPIGTLHSSIDYHLALAYYLKGDYAKALPVYRRELATAANDDRRVSIGHWLYMSLRRLGRDGEAAQVAAQFTPAMRVVENGTYHQLVLMYRGLVSPDSVLQVGPTGEMSVTDATAAYGLANWHWYNGRRAEAERTWRRILAGGQWGAFGYIAAEVELARARR